MTSLVNNPDPLPPPGPDDTTRRRSLTELRDQVHALERFGPPDRVDRCDALGELEWAALERVARGEDGADETISLAAFLARTSHWQTACNRHDLTDESAACLQLADRAVEQAAGEWVRVSLDRPEGADLDAMFDRLTEAGYLLTDIHGRDCEGTVAAHRVMDTREALREMLLGQLKQAPASAAQLGRWARLVADQCVLTLTTIDDLPPDGAATQIESALDDAVWYLKHIDTERGKSSRIVKRKIRRLQAELQERRLQSRLELKYGSRFVGLCERFILFLIILVLGMMTVEWTVTLPADVEFWFAAIDGVACGFFLIEFFTKLSLAEGKARWFGRHFLIDFIPSIPFGLITAVLSAADVLRAGRGGRFMRLPRLARYARSLRPLVQIGRPVGLMTRGIDRIVRQHSYVINCNVIMHPTQDEYARYASQTQQDDLELELLCYQIHDVWLRMLIDAPQEDRVAVSRARLRLLTRVSAARRIQFRDSQRQTGTRNIPAEALLDRMESLAPAIVEPVLGEPMMVQLARVVRTLSIAPLRWLPLIRQCVPLDAALNTDAELVAAASRKTAAFLRRFHDFWFWLSDLHGTVTPSQFVDRVGGVLVKGAARPVIRLALFGGFLLLIETLFTVVGLPETPRGAVIQGSRPAANATEVPGSAGAVEPASADDAGAQRGRADLHIRMLTSVRAFLRNVVGTTVMVVGGICLLGLVIGKWLQYLAREATEFYDKSVQAQFLHLTEMIRSHKLERDAALLYDRVLSPDWPDDGLARKEHLELTIDRLQHSLLRSRRRADERMSRFPFLDRFVLLYRDWLGGGLFTVSDTRATNQLLGNAALRQLLLTSHRISRKDMKLLSAVDLETQKSLFRGPFLWFHLIAQSVAHSVACLLVDYNRRAVPLLELEHCSEEMKNSYRGWLNADAESLEESNSAVDDESRYVTTSFTALHFLAPDEHRDDEVERHFGTAVLERMRRDRSHVVRRTFGTRPEHRRPRAERIFNLYAIYESWFAGGRAVFLPLFVLGVALRFLGRAFGWLLEAVQEIRNPERRDLRIDVAQADFRVAVRKINRIRGPVAERCARLRAICDPAWLGTPLPGETETRLRGADVERDCKFLMLGPAVERVFETERRRSQDSMRRLEQLLSRGLSARIARQHGVAEDSFSKRKYLRAAGIAVHADLHGVRSHLFARSLLDDVYRSTEATPSFRDHLSPQLVLRAAFGRYWKEHGSADSRLRRRAWKATLEDENGVAAALRAWSQQGDNVEREGERRLGEILLHPDRVSEQLLTLRMIQTLTVLDVLHYREQVFALGQYGDESTAGQSYPLANQLM